MTTKKKIPLDFYRNLGKLFYALAAIDGTVNPIEFDTLKSVIKEQWLDLGPLEDDYGTDAAYVIEVVFNWLSADDHENAEVCFEDFVAFKDAQSHLFTDEVKKLILKTGSKVVHAFSGINKSELILMAKLDMELKKI